MLKKWHIFGFVFCLVVLGAVRQYHNPTANQEIVIQFLDAEYSKLNAEKSLLEIVKKLQETGADAITVTSNRNGFFSIAYHTKKSVRAIRQNVSEYIEEGFAGSSNTNKESSKRDYNLDVLKKDGGYITSWDFEGQEVSAFNLKTDRSYNPDVLKHPFSNQESKIIVDYKTECNPAKLFIFKADTISYNIPEVRAGPHC